MHFRTLKPHEIVVDVSVAALAVLLRFAIGIDTYQGIPIVLGVVIGMAAALALRRLNPGLALVVAWVTVATQMTAGLAPDLSNLAILPVLYATASYGSAFVKWFGLVSAILGAFVATAYVIAINYVTSINFAADIARQLPTIVTIGFTGVFAGLAVFVLSWTFGLLAKTWRTARENKAAQVVAEAQQLAAQREVIIEQERNRIARDMHDVVAHSLAVVIAQADGARYASATDPAAVSEALTTISSTAREALGDVRILLGQLRHSQAEGPQPVLEDLSKLYDQLRASGLSITQRELAAPRPLGTGQQLAVYRIIQEALTNALRHGDTTKEVVVTFDWTRQALGLEIRSALGAARETTAELSVARPGHGLAGMRERAILVGGTITSEPRGDEFVVAATLPVTPVGAAA